MGATLRLVELRCDADAFARAAHAAFEDIAHPELAADPTHIDRLSLVGVARVAGDDENAVVLREARDDVLGDPVREVFLVRVARHIVEGEHRDRRLFRQGRIWAGGSRRRWMIRARPVCSLPLDAKCLHRPLNVLESEIALILQYQFQFSRYRVMDGARDDYATDRSLCLEASRDVHTIAIEVVSFDDQIPQMDSDAECHAIEFALVPVHVRDPLLKLDRRTKRSHRTRELGQHPIAGQLNNASAIPGQGGFEVVTAQFLQA